MNQTIENIAKQLCTSPRELWYMLDNIDLYYYEFQKPKMKYGEVQKNNKGTRYRDLLPSLEPLKTIQQNLNLLLQKIELPDYAYGSVKGSNNIINAMVHLGNKYFFSVDLKNFFPNISHHQVFRMFRRYRFSPFTSRIFTKLTTYQGGLPQGAPTSPIIANLVFTETGEKLLAAIKECQITFTSFLDDLTFSSKQDFKPLTITLLEILKKDGFRLQHQKICYKTYLPEVTGIFLQGKETYIKASMKKKAETNQHVAGYLKTINWYKQQISF